MMHPQHRDFVFILFTSMLSSNFANYTSDGTVEVVTSTTDKIICPQKCPEICPDVSHCSYILPHPCNCCPICVRHLNETCGPEIGICDHGLYCREQNSGKGNASCVEMWPERCLKAKCEMIYLRQCPEDSILVTPLPPPGECCAPPAQCQCDIQKCDPFIPICEDGFERALVKEGTSEPGHCCDQFECRRPELRCESVHCDGGDDFEEECPPDSVRAASYVPEGRCCPIYPGCKCRASICSPAQCPEGQRIKILHKGDGTPGRCCDEFRCESGEDGQGADAKRCPYADKMYDDGDTWHSNSCEQCKCRGGIALCSKMTCANPPSHCTWVAIPENECCPVCVGCQMDGEKRKRNETWHKDDCTSCSCGADGVHYCQKHMCQVECDNPRKVAGQCCPVCDEPTIIVNAAVCPSVEHCPLRCENGLLRDSRGCFQCICAPATKQTPINCNQLSDANCDKICAHGYMKDEKGCPVCKCAKCPPLDQCYKQCLYGFETNSNGCSLCKCRAVSRIDAKLILLDKKERRGWDRCFSFSAQTGKLLERDSGEWWNDGCRHCFCEQKHEFCSLLTCPERPDSCPIEQWKRLEECCAKCAADPVNAIAKHEHTVCQSAGRLFVDGETWQLAPCTSCTCRVGNVLCRVVECPPIACPDPIPDESNQCCPKCPETNNSSISPLSRPLGAALVCTDDNDIAHMEGSSWRTDECTSCRCVADGEDTKIECFRENCAELENCLGMPLTIKGRCCPVCSDALSSGAVCNYNKNAYSIHEEWHDGPCRNCTCQPGGRTICKEQQCAPCANPLFIEGQCCPLCRDVGWQSFGEGHPHSIQLDNDTSATAANPMLVGLCIGGCVIVALVAFLLIYQCIKRRRSTLQKKSPIQFNNSKVLLSSSKAIGSTPRLYDEFPKRRDSCGDGQSESLLSTTSESSSAASSNGSSGHGPHFDTLPLTSKKPATRTKSVDYGSGLRRGLGSFKSNPLSKLGEKHGSCNV
uniref:Cysteine-rich motor neuron 1 protein n=1 Tax=Parascaris univalens TaxID=6257 RepID=A0A915AQ40_PARUN